MTVVLIVSGVLLLSAAVITAYRLLAGPNSLDRLVAVDTLIALTVCGVMVWAVYSRDTTLVPSIVALSVVGFVGSVSVARFRVADTPETRRAAAAATARTPHPPRGDESRDRRQGKS
ncbi:cation:proton antiporter [Rhodococcus sp. BP-349]|nr:MULTISPECIES: monovalent cation/H+ antiporter complex subunit F [unclassified Rhodococcus (in: high G+C Gram-positive bacteria)]MBY6539535.1 cation:proton antiporter [Rhodococcus sp. BP-363]MBY6544137.1 cation:proton antiporter [Rhodococcus sp. BP-369]MBY6563367.1 cation:proton antiporter [Rhodococcus sp. BP-370]MBY6577659.1 cation:proton antiporter [Rhodococcus sp. BP-364]MBY6586960.1 cation:proton antiporter [Rhodococcus sp. BP-358]